MNNPCIDKTIIHPEEGCFDMDGGIAYTTDGTLSVKAADVIAQRVY
ncbi:MAG: hypothetical protein RSB18_06245 [Clostridia bacterium]